MRKRPPVEVTLVAKVDPEGPAADIHLVGAVVQRLAGAPVPEPVPVVGDDIAPVGPARRRPLPELVVEPGGTGTTVPWPMLGAVVVVPRLGVVRLADDPVADLLAATCMLGRSAAGFPSAPGGRTGRSPSGAARPRADSGCTASRRTHACRRPAPGSPSACASGRGPRS
jgi:hypothetical protein